MVVKKGIEADIRSNSEIQKILKTKREEYEKLDSKKKEFFDMESLSSPFADTRILNGDVQSNVKSVIVGIDVDPGELILADRLKEKGTGIDLVISHHPAGRAYANFYEVMDLQVDAFIKEGVTVSAAQNLLAERKSQVARRVSAANHQRAVDAARLLGISFLCMHTPCDNLAYQYIKKLMDKEKPATLGKILDILYAIPEYNDAARHNNPPVITAGGKDSRCRRILVEFTGGTEGPQSIYEQLSSSGVDTIIAMHQSEEHFKKCKECNINVVVASHIASDTLGVNIMLDHLTGKEKLKIYEFSGFRRFPRKGSK